MTDRARRVPWLLVFFLLVALAVPWFRWGEGAVVAGLPDWLWYHILWLALTALVFYVFTQRGWGAIVEGKR